MDEKKTPPARGDNPSQRRTGVVHARQAYSITGARHSRQLGLGIDQQPIEGLPRTRIVLLSDDGIDTIADPAREMIAKARPDGVPTALTTYPGAHHAFDVAWLRSGATLSVIGSNTTSRRQRTQ
jgi:hypothetical protein